VPIAEEVLVHLDRLADEMNIVRLRDRITTGE
jgi:hypothetical protein